MFDFQEMIELQTRLQKYIPGFKFNLGVITVALDVLKYEYLREGNKLLLGNDNPLMYEYITASKTTCY